MSSESSSSSSPLSGPDYASILSLLTAIDTKLDLALNKIQELVDADDDDDEEALAELESKSPLQKKTKLSDTPGQLKPYGYRRAHPFAAPSGPYLRKSQTDFGPHPSFGPMTNYMHPSRFNPYVQ